ncbi:MAG: LamB/YcsF family protein [Micromonosporaceae bacterium]
MDLNADVGEGFGIWRLGDDEALLSVVTSANVACGFHGGDAVTLRRVCQSAAARGVSVGAQVSYRDLAGFGRRRIDYQPNELTDEVVYQIGALDGLCRVSGTRVRYVKPHGALYHSCVTDEVQAAAVVRAVREYDPGLPVLGAPGSALLRLATEVGLSAVPEGFADRAYLADGGLVSRTEVGAVLHDPEVVAERAVRMIGDREVETVDGAAVALDIRSLCVHGDTPGAVGLAVAVRQALADGGFVLEPFA